MAIDRGQGQGEPDVEELLEELGQKIERLRVLYEQYFMGIEKVEPQTARKDVTRKLLDLSQLHIRNTALRYRFNMLNQKFSVYTTYWNRTMRAIENGTYFRDVARVGRLAVATGEEIPAEVLKALPPRLRDKILKDREKMAAARARKAGTGAGAGAGAVAAGTGPGKVAPGVDARAGLDADGDIDAAFDNLFSEAEEAVARITASKPPPKETTIPPPLGPAASAPVKPPAAPAPAPPVAAKPAPAPPPVAATPPRGTPALPPGLDEKRAQELYKRFVQAKKLLGENTDNIKYEHVVATIAKQAPAIMKQHQAKSVDFEVVIKDDKVILKATPKK